MSDGNCFTTDKVVVREVSFFVKSYRHLKTQKHLLTYDFPNLVFLFVNILIYSLLSQSFYIQNRKMCLCKKFFTNTFLVSCPP